MIIDAQTHAYERNHPARPWAAELPGPTEVTGEDLVTAMDLVGVDGAIVVSTFAMYRYDPSYAVQVHNAYPSRFALITPVDPRRDDAADVIKDWATTPGAVGVRLVRSASGALDVEDPGVHRVILAATRHSLPVCVLCPGRLQIVGQLADANPDTQFVIDHLGLRQPLEPPPPPKPFADLPGLLTLARYPNVAVKVTGAPTLSHQAFPFKDLWEPLRRVFEAFGIDRCMWGTDWTRTTALVSYADAVAAFRETDSVSDNERAALMGGTLRRIFSWIPADR